MFPESEFEEFELRLEAVQKWLVQLEIFIMFQGLGQHAI